MKKLALVAVAVFASAQAFAIPRGGLGPVRLTPQEVKANAIQSKLSQTMHTNPTSVELTIHGSKWSASELSTFNGTPTPGPNIERVFAEGTIRKSAGNYDVTVKPVER